MTLMAAKRQLAHLVQAMVVVSSVTPLICARRVEYHFGSRLSVSLMAANRMRSSSLPGLASTEMSSRPWCPGATSTRRRRRRRGSCYAGHWAIRKSCGCTASNSSSVSLLDSEDRCRRGDGGGGVVLREKIMRPSALRRSGHQRFDQHAGLWSCAGCLRCARPEAARRRIFRDGHQAGYFRFTASSRRPYASDRSAN